MTKRNPKLPLPTVGALILAGTGLFLFFAATNVQSGWLYALDSLLWAVWTWDLFSANRRVPELTLQRLVPQHVAAGATITDVLSVRATRPIHGIEVSEFGLEQPDDTRWPKAVPLGYIRDAAAQETLTLSGTLVAPARGRYQFALVTFTTHGPFGLFRRPQRRRCDTPIWVHPVIRPWNDPVHGQDAEGNAAGSSRRLGQIGIFAGVRPYRSGDSLRQIHWPLTARRGELSVKELEPPPVLRVTVVLTLAGNDHTEAAVATAADLIAELWHQQIPLTLVGAGRAWEPARWEEILEWLAEIGPADLPEMPTDPGALVVVGDAMPAGTWRYPVAAAYAPGGGSLGGTPVSPLASIS